MAIRTSSVLAAACMLLAAGTAAADPPAIVPGPRCSSPADGWTVLRGNLVAGADCGSLVASTDASDTRFYIAGLFRHVSLGRFARSKPVTAPFELSLEWEWLTPGRWTLEIQGLGIVALVGIDSIGFYVDDAQLMGDTFEPFESLGSVGTHRIDVRQTAREIVVRIDGKIVGRRALAKAPRSGTVIVGIRGAPGDRTRGAIRSFQLRELTSP